MAKSATPRDGFEFKPNAPTAEAHQVFSAWMDSLPPDPEKWWTETEKKAVLSKQVLGNPPELQLLFFRAAIEHVTWGREAAKTYYEAKRANQEPAAWLKAAVYATYLFRDLLKTMSRRKLPWTMDALEAAFASIAGNGRSGNHSGIVGDYPCNLLVKVAGDVQKQGPLPPGLCKAMRTIIQSLKSPGYHRSADEVRLGKALHDLLGTPKRMPLDAEETWAAAAILQISKLPPKQRAAWEALIQHAAAATGAMPSSGWLAKARALFSEVGQASFTACVPEWFDAVVAPKPTHTMQFFGKSPMSEANADVLKGLAWMSGLTASERMAAAVGGLAAKCFAKVTGYGAFNTKIANTCVYTLANLPGIEPIAHLSRLRLKVKTRPAQAVVQAALDQVSRSRNVTPDELEEISVPNFGFDEHGMLRENYDDCAAELRLQPSGEVGLAWFKGGKPVKAAPAEVKSKFAGALTDLKRKVKDIESLAAAQRLRLEHLLVSDRKLSWTTGRDCYLDHKLVGLFARRLIWRCSRGKQTVLGIWHRGRLVDVRDRPLDWLDAETTMSLWHPIATEVATVQAWRGWLESHEVIQPFKQAHREIYLLTDAERRSGDYSNRFAAHILRQHQFAVLARQRGWHYHLQGSFDSANTPTLRLPRWNLQAEFWVEPAGDDASDAGMHVYLATDQVRFLHEKGQAVPLADVPPLAFSEVMRDVDLFVGVASVGNGPTWSDGGPEGRYRDYWQNYSFGDLNTSAKTRKDVLQRLLPKLKIAGQCSFDEKFLVVKGSLRTYKIHLGSGNILMLPNDQYLCIVPKQGKAADSPVLLPFEGDRMLSVIISKTLLLADDAKIKDASIMSQIKR